VTSPRYVQVGYPWAAAFDPSAPAPVSYLAGLIRQTLRYGMPARRFGPIGAWAITHGVPDPLVRTILRSRKRGPKPELDRLLEAVREAWAELADRSPRLPREAPAQLSALQLQRRSAETTFVFGEGTSPLVVCKTPRHDGEALQLEETALQEALAAQVAPKPLGKVGGAYVQEGLPGAPLDVVPVSPDNAGELPWRSEHGMLAQGLLRLAETTKRAGPPQELRPEVSQALDRANLAGGTRDTARAALTDLSHFDVAVLRHGDTSAQNCLFDNGTFTGLVDWEIARPQGAPGFDMLNAAVALIDHGVGLVRWSEQRALRSFERAWRDSGFFEAARTAARSATLAVGADESDYERLEVAFFARRLASRLASPSSYATGPNTAARMLEIACGH
jgi:hypothetical protein